MNKRGWIIPVLIVAFNALAIFVKWSSLPEVLPAHFDLLGNASGTMQRNMLLVYPMIGALICLFAYFFCPCEAIIPYGIDNPDIRNRSYSAFIISGNSVIRNYACLHAGRAGNPACDYCRSCCIDC